MSILARAFPLNSAAVGSRPQIATLEQFSFLAGFERVETESTRIYNVEDARAFLSGQGIDVDARAPQVEGKFMSAFMRATKPAACCGPSCCAS